MGLPPSTVSHFANAIRFAANNGARIINNSWSFSTSCPIPEINDAITYAHQKGCIVVFASGNDSSAVSQPAAGAPSAVLVVGATDSGAQRATYSNYGTSLDIVAPGSDIMTIETSDGYMVASGTSFAAPHVSGILASIWGINPDLPASRVRNIIEQTAQKIGMYGYDLISERPNGTWNQYEGYGLVDMKAAVSAAIGTPPSVPIITSSQTELEAEDLSSIGLGYDKWNVAFLGRSSGYARFYLQNYMPDVTYIWTSTLSDAIGEGQEFIVEYESDCDYPVLHTVECKAMKNGLSVSSGVHFVVSPY